jgi:hypothetical protein
MRRTSLACLSIVALSATPGMAWAQSCIGHPSFATSKFNISADVVVGADYGGLGTDINYGARRNGPFASVGVTGARFVTEPKETRINVGGLLGWERHNKDQLIWCPFVSAGIERGEELDRGNGPETISHSIYGIGLGLAFELERRGRLSFNPFLAARYNRLNTTNGVGGIDTKTAQTGANFGFGLGVRFNEAIQITPSISGSTFPGSNLVFDLRVSLALQKK